MIVTCSKAFAGSESAHERDFLKYYLSKTGQKAVLANEVWSSFRFRILKKSDDLELVEKVITHRRGKFCPEDVKLTEEHQEEEPIDYDESVLFEKTKSLVNRRWADIDFFITQEPKKYSLDNSVNIMTLSEFYFYCMTNSATRELVEEFNVRLVIDQMN